MLKGPRQFLLGTLALLAVTLFPGCRVETAVVVSVAENGGGVVTVEVVADEEAIRRVGTDLEGLRLSDIEDAGWALEGPLTRGELIVHRASKRFGGSEELNSVLGEVLGPEVLADFALERDKRWGEVEYRLSGTLDLTGGLESLGDEALTEALGGAPLGLDLDDLAEELGEDPSAAGTVSLVAVLPGTRSDGTRSEDQPVTADFASTEAIEIDVTTIDADDGPRQWRLMAIGLAVSSVILAVLAIGGSLMGRRAR